MKSFLGMLMLLIVSGDNEVTIKGIIQEEILLPCPCQNRNWNKEFRWQMEEPNKTMVFLSTGNTSGSNRYQGRAKVFVAEDVYNCSLLLTNITADDQGKYRCGFIQKGRYERFFVHLNVSAHYNVCQRSVQRDKGKEFHCEVQGRYRDAEILWYLDKQLLTNSSSTNITTDAHIYTFKSKIITDLSGTSVPNCVVKAKGVSAIMSNNCLSKQIANAQIFEPVPEPQCLRRYFKVIPVVLVIGLSLILLFRWKRSQGLPVMRKVDVNSC